MLAASLAEGAQPPLNLFEQPPVVSTAAPQFNLFTLPSVSTSAAAPFDLFAIDGVPAMISNSDAGSEIVVCGTPKHDLFTVNTPPPKVDSKQAEQIEALRRSNDSLSAQLERETKLARQLKGTIQDLRGEPSDDRPIVIAYALDSCDPCKLEEREVGEGDARVHVIWRHAENGTAHPFHIHSFALKHGYPIHYYKLPNGTWEKQAGRRSLDQLADLVSPSSAKGSEPQLTRN
jgi:hypothetical protein